MKPAARAGAILLIAIGCAPAVAQTARLILITVDGLRADMVDPQTAPNLAALAQAGAHALTAYNDLPSATLPNHATLLTGLTSARHGLLLNIALPGTIPQPTLFDWASAAGLRCVFFASKSKLAHLAPPAALESIEINADTEALVESVVARITADGPDLIFVHLRDPDSIGHRFGWLSAEYLDAVAQTDAQIGRIVATSDADESRDTFLIVSADHGGEGLNHFLNLPANRRVPWIVSGPGIVAVELEQTVSVADTTPTALALLGVALPAGLSGRVHTAVFSANPTALPAAPVAPVGIPCLLLVLPALFVLGGLMTRVTRRAAGAHGRPR